jgi:hypothetical protein
VNIAVEVVVRPVRVPITFILYVPRGFDGEIVIAPVAESTLIKSIVASKLCPSELSTPL